MINKGKFAILEKTNSKLKIKNLIFPNLKKNQVLVKILYTGICGSQLMEIDGKRGFDKYLPHALGHEASGKIINMHNNIKNLKINDKIIISWIKNNYSDCEKIFYLNGKKKVNAGYANTFSNYAIVSKNRCFKKPKILSMSNAALYGCAVPTGFGMVSSLKLKKNSKVIITGFGGIGFFVYLALKSKGIKNIVIIDKNHHKLMIARKLGLKNTFNNIDSKKLEKIFKTKADYCFETTGSAEMISKSFKNLKDNGTLKFASHPKKGELIKIDPYDLIKGKKILGTWGGNINLEQELNHMAKILNKYKKEFKEITKKTYNLDEINSVIKNFRKGKILRPLIKL